MDWLTQEVEGLRGPLPHSLRGLHVAHFLYKKKENSHWLPQGGQRQKK